jgi:hypothetical protein
MTLYRRRAMSERLRTDMQSPCYDEIITEKFIQIDLPDMALHTKHVMGEVVMLL